MEIVAEMEARCSPAELFAWVEDLARYPDWLEIVTRAERLDESSAVAAAPAPGAAPADDDQPAWAIDLRGRVGPLARSKRLRMVRTVHEVPRRARFERAELDGRNHSPWTLEVEVTGDGDRSQLTMCLRYGGGLFAPVIERVLRDEIERSRQRLGELVGGGAGQS